MKELTLIIPFLNEGVEINNTLESVMEHGGNHTEIILINDASTDSYDYRSTAERFGTLYVEHSERQGVAASRDEGVALCTTPYFLLLDGHMRFYDDQWIMQIVSELKNDDRQVLCCQTLVLQSTDGVVSVDNRRATAYGASIDICNTEGILDFQWRLTEQSTDHNTEEIPCILGAAYAASKRYWQYLRGLEGLLYYGSDEIYISMKTWLEGGKCRLLKNTVVGHLYRTAFPYPVDYLHTLYNKLFISELLLPSALKTKVFKALQQQKPEYYPNAFRLLTANRNRLRELKAWYHRIFIHSFDLIVQLNTRR